MPRNKTQARTALFVYVAPAFILPPYGSLGRDEARFALTCAPRLYLSLMLLPVEQRNFHVYEESRLITSCFFLPPSETTASRALSRCDIRWPLYRLTLYQKSRARVKRKR